MIIGNRPNYRVGERGELNKWYFGIEILKCNSLRIRVFKPQIMIWCIKWLDWGECGKLDGRKETRKGFAKAFEFPVGISVEIHK